MKETTTALEMHYVPTGRRIALPRIVRDVGLLQILLYLREWRTEEELELEFAGLDLPTLRAMTQELQRRGVAYERHEVDAEPPTPDDFFSRQVKFLDLFETGSLNALSMQQRLRESRVLLIGAGGWGNMTALLLARMGVGEIVVFDFDHVELSNLNRQVLFGVEDVGLLKVQVLADRIHRDTGGRTKVTTVESAVSSEDDIKPYIASGPTLLMNPFGYGSSFFRKLADIGLALNIATLNYGGGWIGPLTIAGSTACIGCLSLDDLLGETIHQSRSELEFHYGEEFGVVAARAAINCSIACWEAFQFLSGARPPKTLQGVLTIDTMFYSQSMFYPLPLSPECVCGSAAST